MAKTLVKIDSGRLRGSIHTSFEGYEYYAFKGIPYAKPPVGDLRFQDPEPVEPWDGIRDATQFGSPCAQFNQLTRTYEGCDDCLYLNVYVKSINPEINLPVMMWIHGGAYTFGSGDDMFYGPDYLLRKDIVLVTINYRLGVFGFLNLEDEIAPGNQGMKDQVMALKWIKANIINFGGDPNNVTIFGESCGGSSVNYLGLSPMSKGLFHKAISQSGVILNTWASTPNPKQYAYNLCKLLGKETQDSKEIVQFLKTFDSLELARMQEKLRKPEEKLQLLYPFGPGVDSKSPNPFFPIPLDEAAGIGMDVPFLLGHNNREGIYAMAGLQSGNVKDFDINFEKYIHPHMMHILEIYNLSIPRVREMYNSSNLSEDKYLEQLTDLLGDMYIIEGIHRMIKLQVTKSKAPVYFYQFTYEDGISFTKLMINTPINGASHFDEMPHLFSMKYIETLGIEPLEKGTVGYRIMEQMTEMWTNFALTGSPTPVTSKLLPVKWTPVTNPLVLFYMDIGSELSMNGQISVVHRLSGGRIVNSRL